MVRTDKGVGRTRAPSKAVYLLVAMIISLSALSMQGDFDKAPIGIDSYGLSDDAVFINGSMDESGQKAAAMYSNFSPTNVIGLNRIFPEESLTSIENSTMLAEIISAALGLPGHPEPLWNGSIVGLDTTVHRSKESFLSVRERGTWGSRQVAFNFTNGLVTLFYDNLDEVNNSFLSFRCVPIGSSLVAHSLQEMESTAWAIVGSLGIPSEGLAEIFCPVVMENVSVIPIPGTDYQLYEKAFPSDMRGAYCDRLDITFSSKLLSMNVSGANIITFAFNNDTGQLMKVEGSLFVSLPTSLPMSFEQALGIGRNETPSSYSFFMQDPDADAHIEEDQITSVRLFPVIDNGTGSHKDMLGIEYAAVVTASNSSSYWQAIMIIEPSSGSIVTSWVFKHFAPSVSYIVLSDWLMVGILLPVSLLVIGMLLGPPEFALYMIGSLVVPLFMRIKGSDALENFNRGRIFGYISAKPGCSFTELKRNLAIFNGGLAYHLQVLEKLGFVQSVKELHSRRFFTTDVQPSVSPAQRMNKMMSRILPVLMSNERMTTTEVARSVGISRQRAHYNLNRLEKLGLIGRSDGFWQPDMESTDVLTEPGI